MRGVPKYFRLRHPALFDMVNIPLFTGFHTCQVVKDFFHQEYVCICLIPQKKMGPISIVERCVGWVQNCKMGSLRHLDHLIKHKQKTSEVASVFCLSHIIHKKTCILLRFHH